METRTAPSVAGQETSGYSRVHFWVGVGVGLPVPIVLSGIFYALGLRTQADVLGPAIVGLIGLGCLYGEDRSSKGKALSFAGGSLVAFVAWMVVFLYMALT